MLTRTIRAGTACPFTVNFITFMASEAQVDACVEEQVPIASFHWGHPPTALIERLHRGRIKVWEQVGSVEAARRAVDDGVDLVIAQGSEAGGHNYGSLPTLALVPAVVDAVAPTLVLAAGGIADGRQVAAALALGADGVWVGTRLVASAEANAHPEYKRRLVEADGTDTRLTSLFGPEMPWFNPMRVLANRVVRECGERATAAPASGSEQPEIGRTSLLGHDLVLRRFSSFVPMPETEGDLEEMPLLAGQSVGLVKSVKPAGEIIREMMAEAADVVARLVGTR